MPALTVLTPGQRNLLALFGIWAVLMWIVFATRPLLPVDETRYASVAWEMWFRGEQLVPHLNGAPYSHKPPLLFWFMELGWLFFGVSETWARLVAPLFALGGIFLSQPVFRLIWPEQPERALLAPWILMGGFLWTLITTVTMFDMLNAVFTLGAITGVVLVWRRRSFAGWALFGACVGLGILSKGPVILIYTLPTALLAPWWLSKSEQNWWWWYGGGLGAVTFGIAIALAWAVPAGSAGGEEYRAAILWGQTTGRLAESFAHARAFWWYLPILPLALFPWVFWPRVWHGLRSVWGTRDSGLRLCVAWAVPGVLLLSLISAKQPHYLVPLLPAFSFAVAATLPVPGNASGRDLLWPGFIMFMLGVILVAIAFWIDVDPATALTVLDLPDWGSNISILLGISIGAAGAVAALRRWKTTPVHVAVLAAQSLVVVAAFHVFAMRPVAFAYDLKPAAMFVREAIREGRRIAFADEYHGQLHFLGRIEQRFPVMRPGAAASWGQANVRGRIVMVTDTIPPQWTGYEYLQSYRGRVLTIWSGDTLSAYLINLRRDRALQVGAGDGRALSAR